MEVNIAFASSPSSQMGLCIAYKYYFSNLANKSNSFQFNLIAIKPSKSASKSSTWFLNEIRNLNSPPRKSFVWIFLLNNHRDLLFVYILIWMAFAISPWIKILIWQPRFKWIDDLYFLRSISTSLPIPNLKKVLFGDGFLQEMVRSSPFWLQERPCSNNQEYIDSKKLVASIYHFRLLDPSSPFHYSSNSFCIPKEILLSYIHDFPQNSNKILLKKMVSEIMNFYNNSTANSLTILPTTSFFETGRCNLEDEIHLYRKFLQGVSNKSFFLIKPHPVTCLRKLDQLKYLSIEMNGLLLDDTIWNLPLELLIYELIRVIDSNSINLVVASTAGISCARLFPAVNYLPAFGGELLFDCLDSPELEARIRQENLMQDLLAAYI